MHVDSMFLARERARMLRVEAERERFIRRARRHRRAQPDEFVGGQHG